MNRTVLLLAPALLLTLSGCAYDGPLGSGERVRAIMASQVIAPQTRPETGSDGAAAVAAQANYQRSFVTPTPQADSPTFGK